MAAQHSGGQAGSGDELNPESQEVASRAREGARKRGKGDHMTDDERREAQARFLLAFRRSANIREGLDACGVDRKTLARWRKSKTFEPRYQDALADAQDSLRAEAWRRGRDGVEEPLVSGGQLVYEQVPVMEEDGVTPVTDRYGRPKYKRGPLMTVRKYDSALLKTLMAAHLPEHKPQAGRASVEVENPDGSKVRAVFVMPEIDQVAE